MTTKSKVVNPIINHNKPPILDGLYHPFLVKWMVMSTKFNSWLLNFGATGMGIRNLHGANKTVHAFV